VRVSAGPIKVPVGEATLGHLIDMTSVPGDHS
jgi:hypothetical protein